MRRLATIILSGFVVVSAGLFSTPASAHTAAETPNTVTVTYSTPSAGATVGDVFEVRGTVSGQGLDSQPCGAFSPLIIDQGGRLRGSPQSQQPASKQTGDFAFTVNLKNLEPVQLGAPPAQPEPLKSGRIRVSVVGGEGYPCVVLHEEEVELALNYQPDAPRTKPTVQAQASATPTPSAPPSPSLEPIAAEVAEENTRPDPVLLFVLGTLLGAATLALAEFSAKRYHAKHPYWR